MIKLDIYSDPICPWCYIGKSYLDRALEKTVDHPFNIQWHPFQLNPDMPIEGMDRKTYLENNAIYINSFHYLVLISNKVFGLHLI